LNDILPVVITNARKTGRTDVFERTAYLIGIVNSRPCTKFEVYTFSGL
jgi:hypothetical protein